MKEDLIKTLNKVSSDYFANANSLHELGTNSNKLIEASSKQIIDVLKLRNKDIIYTTGSAENDSLCIIGYLENFTNSKHVLVENGIGENIILCLEKMKRLGFSYDFFDTFSLDLIKKNTVLICFANESLDVNKIPEGVKTYIDINAVDKSDLNSYDFISVDCYDICGFPYNGCLIKTKNISLIPLVHGGKSITKYRSGTPNTAFVAALSKAIKLKYKK